MTRLLLILISYLSVQIIGAQNVDVEEFPGEACLRDCSTGETRICYFHFHLEHYHVLGPACGSCGIARSNVSECFNEHCVTADGVERGVMSINRKIPGPEIHVCENDLIVVDVTNEMGGTGAAIHWHGFHQRETPYYDGVPYVTQCPIDYATTFRYAFPATQPGTQFYHSHSGHHKVNGHYGGIVVRKDPATDPNSGYYDRDLKDHLIVLSDWMLHDGEWFMPGLRSHPIGIQPTNLLVNGKGTVRNAATGRSTTSTPLAVFRVQRGQRYRFRFINSMSHICPALLEIENHRMLIIASDSYDLQPVTVDSLISNSGERYDFVITANQTGGEFWMRFRALGSCENRQLEQFAVLSYAPRDVPDTQLAFPSKRFPNFATRFGDGVYLNHPHTTCSDPNHDNFCVTDLSSYVEAPEITDGPADYEFYLGFNNYAQTRDQIFGKNLYEHFMYLRDSVLLVGAINNISFTMPPFSPLTQPELVRDELFCDENNIPLECAGKQICHCVHRIKVPLNAVVELVIVDETGTAGTINHPFHLHGHKLFVKDMGQHPEKIPMTVQLAQQMNSVQAFALSTTKQHAIKDTISIPSRGYTVFRFRADNPGFWLMHCHFEWHMAVGMGLVVQVGETSEMVPAPEGFPKCNNYTPDVNLNVLKR